MTTSPYKRSLAALTTRTILRDPVLLLAHGLGSGLAPKAPGTFGTLAALLPWLLLVQLSLPLYLAVVLVAGVGGVWLCGEAARRMGADEGGEADPGGIVWDEWVGVWIALAGIPWTNAPMSSWGLEWLWVLAAVVLFRLFDILKPGPIGWCDRHLHGGLGIMLDDVAAGLVVFVLLQSLHFGLGLL